MYIGTIIPILSAHAVKPQWSESTKPSVIVAVNGLIGQNMKMQKWYIRAGVDQAQMEKDWQSLNTHSLQHTSVILEATLIYALADRKWKGKRSRKRPPESVRLTQAKWSRYSRWWNSEATLRSAGKSHWLYRLLQNCGFLPSQRQSVMLAFLPKAVATVVLFWNVGISQWSGTASKTVWYQVVFIAFTIAASNAYGAP